MVLKPQFVFIMFVADQARQVAGYTVQIPEALLQEVKIRLTNAGFQYFAAVGASAGINQVANLLSPVETAKLGIDFVYGA